MQSPTAACIAGNSNTICLPGMLLFMNIYTSHNSALACWLKSRCLKYNVVSVAIAVFKQIFCFAHSIQCKGPVMSCDVLADTSCSRALGFPHHVKAKLLLPCIIV